MYKYPVKYKDKENMYPIMWTDKQTDKDKTICLHQNSI